MPWAVGSWSASTAHTRRRGIMSAQYGGGPGGLATSSTLAEMAEPVVILGAPNHKDTMSNDLSGRNAELQFDTAVPKEGGPTGGTDAVVCRSCNRAIDSEYYDVSGTPVCVICRPSFDALLETPRGLGPLVKA